MDGLTVNDQFAASVSRVANDGSARSKVRASDVPMMRPMRLAFSRTLQFNLTTIQYRVLALYCDFDMARALDLMLSPPNVMSVTDYAQNDVLRRKLPGYVMASVMRSLSVGGNKLKLDDRKRKASSEKSGGDAISDA